MAIPSTNAVAACMLRALDDGGPHILRELRDELADDLRLSADDLAALLGPDSTETRFGNRVAHARTLLVRLGLAEQPPRGAVQITRTWRAVLAGDRSPRAGIKNATSTGLLRRLDDGAVARGRRIAGLRSLARNRSLAGAGRGRTAFCGLRSAPCVLLDASRALGGAGPDAG